MARKQSSTIWFDGNKHHEIWFDGHWHDKMYLTDSVGSPTLVWEKLNGIDDVYISSIKNSSIVQLKEITYGLCQYTKNGVTYSTAFTYNEDKPRDTQLGDGKLAWHLIENKKLWKCIEGVGEGFLLDEISTNGTDLISYGTQYKNNTTSLCDVKTIRQINTDDFSYKTGKDMELTYPIVVEKIDRVGSTFRRLHYGLVSLSGEGTIIYNNRYLSTDYDSNLKKWLVCVKDFDGNVVSQKMDYYSGLFFTNKNYIYILFGGTVYCTDMEFSFEQILFDKYSTDLYYIDNVERYVTYHYDKTYVVLCVTEKSSNKRNVICLEIDGLSVNEHILRTDISYPSTPTLLFTKKDESGNCKILYGDTKGQTIYNENFSVIKEKPTDSQSTYGISNYVRRYMSLDENTASVNTDTLHGVITANDTKQGYDHLLYRLK